jgi:hypothetical protein
MAERSVIGDVANAFTNPFILPSKPKGKEEGLLSSRHIGPTIGLAALLAGAYGGYTLADSQLDDTRDEDLEKDIAAKENELQQTQYRKIEESRQKNASVWEPGKSLGPTATIAIRAAMLASAYGAGGYLVRRLQEPGKQKLQQGSAKDISAVLNATDTVFSPDPSLDDTAAERQLLGSGKTANEKEAAPTISDRAKASYLLAAALFASVGHVAAKSYFDKRDPNRVKLDLLKRRAREMALTDKAPKIIPVTPDFAKLNPGNEKPDQLPTGETPTISADTRVQLP